MTSDSIASSLFGELFQTRLEAAFVVDRQSLQLLSANDRLEEIVGRACDGMVGDTAETLFCRDESGVSYASHIVERAGLHEDVAIRRIDEYPTFVSLTVAHINCENGRKVAACVAHDTTERRILEREVIAKHSALWAAQAELQQTVEQLRETQRHLEVRSREVTMLGSKLAHVGRRAAIGEFSAGLAHSMNNPIGALVSSLRQIAKRLGRVTGDEVRADLERFLTASNDAATRLEGIVNSVRRAHRSGNLDDASRSLDILNELDMALALFDGRLSGIRIHRTGVDDTHVWAPPDSLHQVLSNLIDNAIRAMPMGGDLHVGMTREVESVVVSIADSGPGLPAEIVDKLFEPFASTRPDGTGLGLSTARRLARTWGGELIWVPSPTGCRFDVRIPTQEQPCDQRRS